MKGTSILFVLLIAMAFMISNDDGSGGDKLMPAGGDVFDGVYFQRIEPYWATVCAIRLDVHGGPGASYYVQRTVGWGEHVYIHEVQDGFAMIKRGLWVNISGLCGG